MTLRHIHLELARTPEFPNGSPDHGYELVAPLTAEGELDGDAWKADRQACTVRHFRPGRADEHGHLVRLPRSHRWVFLYAGDEIEDAEEELFRFDRHHFIPGEYVSITERDGETLTYRVRQVR